MNKFGERLKELRQENGIGQVELAKQISVSKGIISLWENGLREPTLSNLCALCDYLTWRSTILSAESDIIYNMVYYIIRMACLSYVNVWIFHKKLQNLSFISFFCNLRYNVDFIWEYWYHKQAVWRRVAVAKSFKSLAGARTCVQQNERCCSEP